MELKTPRVIGFPLVKGGFNLNLKAVSPRKTPSASRKAGVTSFAAVNGTAVHTAQIGAAAFKKDGAGKFIKLGAKKPHKEDVIIFEFGNRVHCVVSGETAEGKSFTCSCTKDCRIPKYPNFPRYISERLTPPLIHSQKT